MLEITAVLHDIRSAHNVGSMFRTADAAGVGKVYLSGVTPEPEDRFGRVRQDFSKVSLGAEHTVPWERVGDTSSTDALLTLVKNLQDQGYAVCAVEQAEGSLPYWEGVDFASEKNKIALVMGNEVDGVPPSILGACDAVLEIPMYGRKESLNVSVAFGVIVFGLRCLSGRG